MKYWIALLAVVLAVALAYAAWPKEAHTGVMAPASTATRTIIVGTTTVSVDIADTEALREHGLSDRTSTPQGHGMLFIFDAPGNWGIWMKDMHFPLDILWARADGTVITVARDVSPETYPQIFYPATPDALYVVELNAGAAANIVEGSKIVL